MSNAVEKLSGHFVGELSEPSQTAQTASPRFEVIEKVAGLSIPLRRPKKVGPSLDEAQLQAELTAWEAASDEAFEMLDEAE